MVLLQLGYNAKDLNDWGKNKKFIFNAVPEMVKFDYDYIENSSFRVI